MRSNFVSIPTDCPQRDERMGWTGDICLFVPTAAYLYDVYGFLKSWLKDVRADQVKWGTVPFYVPFVPLGVWAHPQAISTWGDSAVEVPWTLYMESGDVQVLGSPNGCCLLSNSLWIRVPFARWRMGSQAGLSARAAWRLA